MLTLNTHRVLYRPTRVMYEVASALAIWQREIENILRDIPDVNVFLDMKTSTNDTDHLQKLDMIFKDYVLIIFKLI